jgi:hypothetical protein
MDYPSLEQDRGNKPKACFALPWRRRSERVPRYEETNAVQG